MFKANLKTRFIASLQQLTVGWITVCSFHKSTIVKLNTAIEGEQNRGDKELEKKKRA
jgi:hypothetical protein